MVLIKLCTLYKFAPALIRLNWANSYVGRCSNLAPQITYQNGSVPSIVKVDIERCKCKQNKGVELSNWADQTWWHDLLSPMMLQLVSKTKVITITKHLLKCVTFLKVPCSKPREGDVSCGQNVLQHWAPDRSEQTPLAYLWTKYQKIFSSLVRAFFFRNLFHAA